jgi:SAM-dependent methyltransferase
MTGFAAFIRKSAPPGVLKLARRATALSRRIECDLEDLQESLAGKSRPLTPPRRMWEMVGGRGADFHDMGKQLADLVIAHGLKPEHRVLDIGSGIGRLAVPLTRYLTPPGSYDGVDIMPAAVEWCQRAVTPAWPAFRFQSLDVRNDRYNPNGASPAATYVFPFQDATFDFVFLGSVFTHMFAPDMRNYLTEISRMMRPGATCVISYYLVDDSRRANVAAGPHGMSFQHPLDGAWCEFPEIPEAAIAFDKAKILTLYEDLGLRIETVTLGAWDRSPNQDQDLIVARKG